jgi:chromosome segregation ATPase
MGGNTLFKNPYFSQNTHYYYIRKADKQINVLRKTHLKLHRIQDQTAQQNVQLKGNKTIMEQSLCQVQALLAEALQNVRTSQSEKIEISEKSRSLEKDYESLKLDHQKMLEQYNSMNNENNDLKTSTTRLVTANDWLERQLEDMSQWKKIL